jgi:transposase
MCGLATAEPPQTGNVSERKIAREVGMASDPREQALRATEQELRHERAASLGRSGRQLEQLIVEVERAIETWRASPESERAEAFVTVQKVREQAHYQLWCYLVQREAIGLSDHSDVHATYRIPERPST